MYQYQGHFFVLFCYRCILEPYSEDRIVTTVLHRRLCCGCSIPKTCTCNIAENVRQKFIFSMFVLKTLIVGTQSLNIDYGYSLELPRRGGSNVYPQSMF